MLLRPGKSTEEAVRLFDDIQSGSLNNLRNEIPLLNAPDFPRWMAIAIRKYTEWTAQAAKQIREVVDDPAVAARLRNETYWVVMASDINALRTFTLLQTELQEVTTFFMDCANELRIQQENAKRYGNRPLVLDTNDLLHYQRFDKIPWSSLYGKTAHVIIPHVVVDEIDAKSYGEGGKFPKRARGVYRVLEEYLDRIEDNGSATLPDGTTLEILADDPGHVRFPNNDNELVARAAFLQQAVYPNRITILTRDIGMRTRAVTRLLRAEKLPDKYLIPSDGLSAADLDAAVASIDIYLPETGSR
jgi:PIN domain